ncbi:MAG: sigma 54-interacting transcriptional regulator, partial [Thermodesulfobacteriota bacterium]
MPGREVEGRFRINPERLLGAIYNGVAAIDPAGGLIYLNQTASEIFDLPVTEALGRPILEALPKIGRPMVECLEKGTKFVGLQLKVKKAFLAANINPIYENGDRVGVIGVFQDISQVEKMARDIQLYKGLNRRLETIIDFSCDGLFVTDGKGIILRCNKSSEKLIGHKQEDILGKNVRELLRMGYIDHSVTLEVLKKKETITILQKLRNGKKIIVTGTPVLNETGEIDYVVTNERDISHLNIIRHQLVEDELVFDAQEKEKVKPAGRYFSSGIVAVDIKIRHVLEMAHIASQFDTTVLLLGESGVGKGVVARYIHESSKRQHGPFVKINCGAIPVSLVESELFGYKKGAFTGASSTGKAGLIEMAEGGTLFLDEIGELPLSTQVKLLRVLEDRHITPVGGIESKEVNVRIIAATNRDLKDMVAEGSFREDLYFRLNVVPIGI